MRNAAPTLVKPCPGTCRSGGCAGAPRVWVVAACEGMLGLLEKRGDDVIVARDMQAPFPSIEAFQEALKCKAGAIQLVLVGSANDIAWTHHCLPQNMVRYVVAEMEYPLVSQWFREPQMAGLTRAVSQLFH